MKYQSNILSDARGKLNGMVFTRGRYGAVIRNKVSPVQPDSPTQSLAKQNFGALSASFRDLTQDQIASWNEAAVNWPRNNVFGQQYLQSGLNLYVGLNQNLTTAGQATIVYAPVPSELPVIVITSVIADQSSAAVSVGVEFNGVAAVPAGYSLVVAATPQLSAGRSFVKNLFRDLVVAPAATATAPLAISTEYSAKFGNPAIGNKIYVQVRLIDNVTGQATIAVNSSTIAVI